MGLNVEKAYQLAKNDKEFNQDYVDNCSGGEHFNYPQSPDEVTSLVVATLYCGYLLGKKDLVKVKEIQSE